MMTTQLTREGLLESIQDHINNGRFPPVLAAPGTTVPGAVAAAGAGGGEGGDEDDA